ncbi:MAG TPA: TIGR01777 family oxidoreductase [Candidatus Sulfotelmatobacter sp.]|nr:TIGR01777 family oxidoreductase [Candidatus Sulfotelmatobacter sp.]
MISRILVSGTSGPIGAALLPSLKLRGYEVVRLVRKNAAGVDEIAWDPAREMAPATVSGFDAVIHLAGESIAGRWTEAKKKKIRDSRVNGTTNLSRALAAAENKPQVFVCGSAIGFYGSRGEEVLKEDGAPGTGFLPEVCREWEAATQTAVDAGIRTAHLRTGIVLSPKGGALGQMLTPFKMGVGGRIGDGKQWMSWIDVQDMVGGIHHILKTDLLQGPVNMVAPKPVRNEEFTKTLASVLSRPAIFPVPAFAVKLLFGEMGTTLLLGSQRVEPTQLVGSGYPFRFSTLRTSLEAILK